MSVCDGNIPLFRTLCQPDSPLQMKEGQSFKIRLSIFPVAENRFMTQPFGISSGVYFYPESLKYQASFSMDVTGPTALSGWLKYYYTRTRMNFVSTGITSVSASGNMATISGTGTVNGVGGYTFTTTVTNGTPDTFAIVIKKPDGTNYYSAGPKNISGGDLVISPL